VLLSFVNIITMAFESRGWAIMSRLSLSET